MPARERAPLSRRDIESFCWLGAGAVAAVVALVVDLGPWGTASSSLLMGVAWVRAFPRFRTYWHTLAPAGALLMCVAVVLDWRTADDFAPVVLNVLYAGGASVFLAGLLTPGLITVARDSRVERNHSG